MRKSLILIVLALCIIAVFIPTASSSTTVTCPAYTSDGYLTKTDADYDTAHHAAIAGAIDISNPLRVGQVAGWTIYRSYLYFDTISIPDGATIYEARLHFFVQSGTPMTIRAIQDPLNGHPQNPLVTGDYDISNYEGTLFGLSQLISGTGWQELIIYDYDQPDYINVVISKTGTTKLCLLSEVDYEGLLTAVGTLIFDSQNQGNKPHLEIIYNQKPATPAAPTGAATVYRNYAYAISFSTTDPEGDQVKYDVDWGDGTQHLGYYASGETVSITHKYGNNGLKTIKVRAVDNDTHGLPDWTGWSAGAVVNVSTKAVVNYNDLLASSEDPNQKIERVSAEIYDETGWKNLRVWWTLNDAGNAQGDLNILVTLENINGSTVLYDGPVRDHLTKETAVIMQGFDTTYKGWDLWNFKIKATLTNPAEPYKCDKGDNTAELYMVLGMWIYLDFIFFSVIALLILLIALVIYKERRFFFKKWYNKYNVDPDTGKIIVVEEGDMPGLIERLGGKKNRIIYLTTKKPREVWRDIPSDFDSRFYNKMRHVSSYLPGATFVYGGLNKRKEKTKKWWKDLSPDTGERIVNKLAHMNEAEARKYAERTKERLTATLASYKASGKKMPKEMSKDIKRAIVAIDNKYYPKTLKKTYIKESGLTKPTTRWLTYPLYPLHRASKRITKPEREAQERRKGQKIQFLPLIPEKVKEAKKGKRGRKQEKEKVTHSIYYSKSWHFLKPGEAYYDKHLFYMGVGKEGDRIAVPKRNEDGTIDKSVKAPKRMLRLWNNQNKSEDELKEEERRKQKQMELRAPKSPNPWFGEYGKASVRVGVSSKYTKYKKKRKRNKSKEGPARMTGKASRQYEIDALTILDSYGIEEEIFKNPYLEREQQLKLYDDRKKAGIEELKAMFKKFYRSARRTKSGVSQPDVDEAEDMALQKYYVEFDKKRNDARKKRTAISELRRDMIALSRGADVYASPNLKPKWKEATEKIARDSKSNVVYKKSDRRRRPSGISWFSKRKTKRMSKKKPRTVRYRRRANKKRHPMKRRISWF